MHSGEVTDWQRLHPLSLVAELVMAVPQVGFLLIVLQTDGEDLGALDLIEFPLIIAPAIAAVLRYFFARYAVTSEAVFHEKGVIFKKKQMMARSNVQNVNSNAPLIARVFGLVEVSINDASAANAILIRFVDAPTANQLVADLSATRKVDAPLDQEGNPAPDTPSPRYNVVVTQFGDLIKAELGSVVYPAAFLAISAMAVFILNRSLLDADIEVSMWFLYLSPLWFVFFAVMAGASRIGKLSNFVLDVDASNFYSSQGMLTQVKNTSSRDRLQLIRIHEHPWLSLIKLNRISYDTADVREAGGTQFLQPAGPADDWSRVVEAALDRQARYTPDMASVSRLTIRRLMVRFAFVALLPLLAITVATVPAIIFSVAILGFGAWYSIRRWEILAFQVNQNYLYASKGVFNKKRWIVRLDKIQGVTLHSTIFQRRLDLATVSFGCGGSSSALHIPDLPSDVARKLTEILAERSCDTPLERTI